MATNIDKALYQAPVGLDSLAEEPAIEIEVVNPEEMTIGVDGLEITLKEEPESEEDFDANLAESMDEAELESIAAELISDVDEDVASRKDWLQTYVDGLELLGLKIEDRAEPWEGACGVYHPIMAEALVKFQADAMMSTFPAGGPVKTQIIGRETTEKKEAALRVAADMNYRLTDKNKEYRTEHERMLWGLGLAGNAFKKVYYDPHFEREASIFVPAEDLIVPYGASNLETAERITHVMRKTKNDMRRLQVAGFWRDIDLGEPQNVLDEVEKKIAEKLGFRATTDDRYKILEINVDLNLKGHEHLDENGDATGIALPYIVTIEKGSQKVLAIRRNWRPEDPTCRKRQHFVHYPYIPGFGFYAFGLIHMIGAFAKSGTSLLRQLVDAGSLANLPGGFKTRGLRVKGDDTPIAPGEFRDVDVPAGTIKDNLLPLPYKEPSQTLYQLLNQIIEDGRRFANTADLQVTDMSSQAPVGTTLAILERTLKVMSAVQARIHFAFKEELGLIKEIIRDYTPDDYDYVPEDGQPQAKKSDYDNVDVIPVSDPNASTMAQKIVQYQAALQLAAQAPQLYNQPLLHRQMLDVLGIKNAEKLVPLPEDQAPTDPVTENQNILMAKPVKAFAYQNHRAHIEVHMAAMNDPMIQQLLQKDPTAQQKAAAMQAHINEHLGFEYRVMIEQALGMTLPPQTNEEGNDIPMNPEVEAQLAPMLAQAAQRVLQQNQATVAQQQAQQAAQDPVVQMQQQELAIKQGELQRKAQKDQVDAELKKRQQDLEAARTVAQSENARKKDALTIAKELLIHDKDQKHENANKAKEIMADALRNVYQTNTKGD
ncbi:hypothetical protein EBT31_07510 [bacterium]|nr:hypothetical protein [bacterium]NBX48759.1 hypothetical protein [bacterium]